MNVNVESYGNVGISNLVKFKIETQSFQFEQSTIINYKLTTSYWR